MVNWQTGKKAKKSVVDHRELNKKLTHNLIESRLKQGKRKKIYQLNDKK